MSTTFLQHVFEEGRARILMLLDEQVDGGSHVGLITSALDQCGLTMSTDQVITQVQWLAENGLVEIERIKSVMRARITPRGAQVARGRAHVEGVMRRRDVP